MGKKKKKRGFKPMMLQVSACSVSIDYAQEFKGQSNRPF